MLAMKNIDWEDLLTTLSNFTGRTFRLVDRDGGTLAQAGAESALCRALGCGLQGEGHCLSGGSAENGELRRCTAGVTRLVLPVQLGGNFVGRLLCGEFWLEDEPFEEGRASEIAEAAGLTPAEVDAAYKALVTVNRQGLEVRRQSLRSLLENMILEKEVEATITRVRPEIVKLQAENLWTTIEDAVRAVLPVDSVEVFTASPRRDAVTRELPDRGVWDSEDRFEDFVLPNGERVGRSADGRYVAWLYDDERPIAIFRVESPQPWRRQDLDRYKRLAEGIAEALVTRRRFRAVRELSRIRGASPRQKLCKFVEVCCELAKCDHGEVLLRDSENLTWLKNVARGGVYDESRPLPHRVPADVGLTHRALEAKLPVVVTDTEVDPDFQALLDTERMSVLYPGDVLHDYRSFLREVKSCIKLPILIDGDAVGLLCLHRRTVGPFNLGMVQVIELMAERAALECARLLVSDEESVESDRQRNRIPSHDDLFAAVQGRTGTDAVRILLNKLAEDALAISKAYRTAAGVISLDGTKISVIARRGEWARAADDDISFETTDSAVVYAIVKGRDYWVPERNARDVRYVPAARDLTRSFAAVRLRHGSNVLGVLDVEWKEPQGYTSTLKSNLELLAERYADVIRANDVSRQMNQLDEMIQEFRDRKDRDALFDYQSYLQRVGEIMGVSEGAIFTRDRDSGRYVLRASLCHKDKVATGESYELGQGLTGWVLKRNRCLRLANLRDSDEVAKATDGEATWANHVVDNREVTDRRTAYLAVPLSVGEQALGALRLNIPTEWRCFDYVDENFALAMASRLAGQLYEEEQTKRTLARLRLAERIASIEDMPTMTKEIFDALREGLGAVGGHIRMADESSPDSAESPAALLRVGWARPDWAQPEWEPKIVADETGGIARWVWRNKRTFVDLDVGDVDSRSRKEGEGPPLTEVVGSLAAAPLIVGSGVAGTLHVYKKNRFSFSHQEIEFVEHIARLASAALRFAEEAKQQRLALELQRQLDSFFMQFFQTNDAKGAQRQLLFDLLKVLQKELQPTKAWLLVPDGAQQNLEVWKLDGSRAGVSPFPIRDFRQVVGADGVHRLSDLSQNSKVREWMATWDPSLKDDAQRMHPLSPIAVLAMHPQSARPSLLAWFCIVIDPARIVSQSARKAAEEALHRVAEEVDLANLYQSERRFAALAGTLAVIGVMTSNMEHEFREPLNELKQLADYLKKDRKPEDIRRRAELMRTALERHGENMELVMQLAKQKQPHHACNLSKIIDDSLKRVLAKNRPREIRQELQIDGVRVRADGSVLQCAFGFVLMNAADAVAGMEAGYVSIKACIEDDDRLAVIEIADNGRGMDEDTQRKAMEPFFSRKNGSGLGLTAAFCIISALGGTLRIDFSAPGIGTQISIRLPYMTDEE